MGGTEPKDMMAEYIRQLLELDEVSRCETLQSLSEYAESKTSNSIDGPGGQESPAVVEAPCGVMFNEPYIAELEDRRASMAADVELQLTPPRCSLRQAAADGSLPLPVGLIRNGDEPEPEVLALQRALQDLASSLSQHTTQLSPELSVAVGSELPLEADVGRTDQSHPYATPVGQEAAPCAFSSESDAKTDSHLDTANSSGPARVSLQAMGGEEISLRSYLNHLKNMDAGCILLVRKINRLGFDSAAILANHYGAYGHVEHVFVPRSRSVARSQSQRPFIRRRPSGIGFIVMGESAAVDAILEVGEAQPVNGVWVQLQRFRPQNSSFLDEEEESADKS